MLLTWFLLSLNSPLRGLFSRGQMAIKENLKRADSSKDHLRRAKITFLQGGRNPVLK